MCQGACWITSFTTVTEVQWYSFLPGIYHSSSPDTVDQWVVIYAIMLPSNTVNIWPLSGLQGNRTRKLRTWEHHKIQLFCRKGRVLCLPFTMCLLALAVPSAWKPPSRTSAWPAPGPLLISWPKVTFPMRPSQAILFEDCSFYLTCSNLLPSLHALFFPIVFIY